jgi:hypothetical protein
LIPTREGLARSQMPNFIEQQAISKSSDEAPEAVSMSASKIQALNIKKKEREVQQKYV